MGRKKSPSLLQRKCGTWYIDKKMYGQRICESTGSCNLEEAERFLAFKLEQLRRIEVYGDRRPVLFKDAAVRYIDEKSREGKSSLESDKSYLRRLFPSIGHMHLHELHMGTLTPHIDACKRRGLKNTTINHDLKVVRQILKLAASNWFDDRGNTWIQAAPPIKLLDKSDERPPRPLDTDELNCLYAELPSHLEAAARFAANAGCRSTEICELRWEWEYEVPELGVSVFVIPAWVYDEESRTRKGMVKNRQDRLVVLNHEALKVIESCRGKSDEFVFTYKGKPFQRLNNTSWRKARIRAGLEDVRVHDLRHTFGMALRAANVRTEDIQDLLGHKSKSITKHYSAASIENLLDAANKVCESVVRRNILTLRRKAVTASSRKSHVRDFLRVV